VRTNNDEEWSRVRVSPSTYACDGFSWLRPAVPGSISVRHPRSSQLAFRTSDKSGGQRLRRPRVDEANAVLDVQFAVDDIHRLDLAKIFMRQYYFHPENLLLDLHPSPNAFELRLTATSQNLGVRFWWLCPTCNGRRRYLYYYRMPDQTWSGSPSGALGCRQCLGLTYRSRSRHRCGDYDREKALSGDLGAAARVLSRVIHRQHSDEALIEELRRKLHRRANDLLNAGRQAHEPGPAPGRRK
jgi:hypothetical protein